MMKGRPLYLFDLKHLFLRKWDTVLKGAALLFFLTLAFLLSVQKPLYRADATFKEGQKPLEQAALPEILLRTLHNQQSEVSIHTLMRSKTLLGAVVEKLGHQIVERETVRLGPLLARSFERGWEREMAQFRDVHYGGDAPITFFVKPTSEHSFVLLDEDKKEVPITSLGDVHFSIESLPKKTTAYTLLPKREAVLRLSKQLKIKETPLHRSALFLTYRHENRQMAIDTLNTLMACVQEHLKSDHERVAREQIAYLKHRQKELGEEYEQSLETHVAYLRETLGEEGVLGLAQELEELIEPREEYTAKKHQLELDAKRWRGGDLLASAEHPWKEGLERQSELSLETAKIAPFSVDTSEFEGIDLDTAQTLYGNYTLERDRCNRLLREMSSCTSKIDDPSFELSGLLQVLSDPISSEIIKRATTLSMQLADPKSWSEKEQIRIKESLQAEKSFLKEHIAQESSVLEMKLALFEEKMRTLKQTALLLLEKEKGLVEEQLSLIQTKMAALPEKWALENRLKLKKDLIKQILEGLTQLSESKVIARNLFQLDSKPLDLADALPLIEHPHFLLYSSLGGLVGAFFTFLLLLSRQMARGFPISAEFLRAAGYQLFSKEDAAEELALRLKEGEAALIIGEGVIPLVASSLKKIGKDEVCSAIETTAGPASIEARNLLRHADVTLLVLGGEKEEVLIPYDKEKTLCVLTQ